MGDFDKYNVKDIKEIADADKPAAMREQAEGWANMKTFFDDYLSTFDGYVAPLKSQFKGAAAKVFFDEVEKIRTVITESSKIAQGNSEGWNTIADRADTAKTKVDEIYGRYQQAWGTAQTKYETEKKKDSDNYNWGWGGLSDLWDDPKAPKQSDVMAPFDREARTEMDSATTVYQDQYMSKIFYPPTYEPLATPPDVKDPGEWYQYSDGPGTGTNPPGAGHKTVSPPPSSPPPNSPPPPPPSTPPPYVPPNPPSTPPPYVPPNPPSTPPPYVPPPDLEFPPVPPPVTPPPVTPPPYIPPPTTPPPVTPPPYIPPPTVPPPPTGQYPKPPGQYPKPPTGQYPKPPTGQLPKPPTGQYPKPPGTSPTEPPPKGGTPRPGTPPKTGPGTPPKGGNPRPGMPTKGNPPVKNTQYGKVTDSVLGKRNNGLPGRQGLRGPGAPNEGVLSGRNGAPSRGAGQPGVRSVAPKPVKVSENGVLRGARGNATGNQNMMRPATKNRRDDDDEETLKGDGPLDDELFRVDGGVPGVMTSHLPYTGEHEAGPTFNGRPV